jgi:hypothetical protein
MSADDIAAKLTKAQECIILRSMSYGKLTRPVDYFELPPSVATLFPVHSTCEVYLTPLGLEVRNHITKGQTDG